MWQLITVSLDYMYVESIQQEMVVNTPACMAIFTDLQSH